MKRVLPLALTALALLLPPQASAIDWTRAEVFLLDSNEVLSAQTLLYANAVRIDGQVQDDLFVLAADTALNGQAEADAWILGSSAAITGRILGHTRVLAQTLTLSGGLDRDLTAIASVARITTNVVVGGAVDLIAEQASLEGSFHGRVRVLARSATLAGTYADTVRVIADDIVVLPGTQIAGDLIYTSPKELFLDRSVLLGGALKRQSADARPEAARQDWIPALALQSAKALAALLCGVALLAFFPRLAGRSVRHLQRAPVRCALLGLAALLVMPISAFLLTLTIVGVPLALLTAGAWVAGLYLAKIIVGLWVGRLLLRRPAAPAFGPTALRLLVGLAALYAAMLLPVIGGSLALLIGISGFGALGLGVVRGDDRRGHPPDTTADPGESS